MTVNTTYPVLDGNGSIRMFPAQQVDATQWPANLLAGLFEGVPVPALCDAAGRLVQVAVLLPSGRTPVSGTLGTATRSPTFGPIPGRGFNVTIWGTFDGAVRLERSFDSGSTWHALTGGGFPIYAWTGPASETAIEYEDGVIYSLLATTLNTGDIDFRISQ